MTETVQQIWDVFSGGIIDYVSNLNFSYIIVYMLIIYGLKEEKEEMGWYRKVFKDLWGGIWAAGIIIGIFYALLSEDFFINGELNRSYLAYLLHSYIVTIILYNVVVGFIANKLKKTIKKKE